MRIPEPLYPCAFHDRDDRCRGDKLCYARGLYRPLRFGNWVCEHCCYEHLNLTAKDFGISLAEHLKQTVAVVPRELTAENGAKAALMGEFHEAAMAECVICQGAGCWQCKKSGEYEIEVPVTWTTIKAIHAKMIEHFEKEEE